jgi:hypothetical protein
MALREPQVLACRALLRRRAGQVHRSIVGCVLEQRDSAKQLMSYMFEAALIQNIPHIA